MCEIKNRNFLSSFDIVENLSENTFEDILSFRISNQFRPSSFVVGSFFEESSSRTRFSTESIIQKLGGNIVHFSSLSETSINKGESIKESARLWSEYFDLIAIRSKNEFLPHLFGKFASVPVINMGDGSNEHPTQGLATVVHMYRIFEKIKGLNVCLWGDFNKSRTMHSVAIALSLLGANLFICSIPSVISDELTLKKIKEYNPCAKIYIIDSIPMLQTKIDLFYITRLQRERWNIVPEYSEFLPEYCDKLSDKGIILHPLPHNMEISDDVLFHKKSKIYDHVVITKQTRAWLINSYKELYDRSV
ncbi:MAG: hypothetical protein IJ220_03025 [Clostridia bacterium]|nr:hypothetical protein [Clostridia bacterium]